MKLRRKFRINLTIRLLEVPGVMKVRDERETGTERGVGGTSSTKRGQRASEVRP